MLATNKARSNWSNTREFLRPSKRRKLDQLNAEPEASGGSENHDEPSSSARTSAIKVDRDVQMKYDIAKNPDGPLGRTMLGKLTDSEAPSRRPSGVLSKMLTSALANPNVPTLARHSGLQERFSNIEKHLRMQWGESW